MLRWKPPILANFDTYGLFGATHSHNPSHYSHISGLQFHFMLRLGRVQRSFIHLWAGSYGFIPFHPSISILQKRRRGRVGRSVWFQRAAGWWEAVSWILNWPWSSSAEPGWSRTGRSGSSRYRNLSARQAAEKGFVLPGTMTRIRVVPRKRSPFVSKQKKGLLLSL